MNLVMVLGNVGKDCDLRYTPNGKAVGKFSVATSKKINDQQKTEWHNIVMWGKLAERMGPEVKKGNRVFVKGEMITSNWEKDGVKHYKTEINAQEVFIQTPAGTTIDKSVSQAEPDFQDTEIPF